MDALVEWLNPLSWLDWASDHPWLTLAIAAPVAALVVWRLVRGGLGTRRAVINVIGVALVIWGAQWFADWVKPSLTPEDLFTPPVVGPQAVRAVFVEQKTLERTSAYTGTVHPFERIVLRARTEGFVKEVSAYPGDRLREGEIVVRQETSELEPRLEEAMANLRYLRAERARDEALFRSGGVSASQLDLSRKSAQAAAATVDLLETEIGYATVRAPSDGWVSKRAVDPGQYVRKGDHLLAYDRLARVRIRFDVAVQDLIHIGPGSEVILELPEIAPSRLAGTELAGRLEPGYRAAALRATVTSVFPSADERTRLAVVEVVIPNPDLILKSNAYVIAHFVTGRVENAWTVPEAALTPMPGGKTVVFLAPAFAEQGAAEMREVTIGLRNGKEAQVLEGLSEPAYVVVAGNRSLAEGETVTVIAREGGL